MIKYKVKYSVEINQATLDRNIDAPAALKQIQNREQTLDLQTDCEIQSF